MIATDEIILSNVERIKLRVWADVMNDCHSQTELARPPKHIALNKSKIRLPLNILHRDFYNP